MTEAAPALPPVPSPMTKVRPAVEPSVTVPFVAVSVTLTASVPVDRRRRVGVVPIGDAGEAGAPGGGDDLPGAVGRDERPGGEWGDEPPHLGGLRRRRGGEPEV